MYSYIISISLFFFCISCTSAKKTKSISKSDDKNNVISVTDLGGVKRSGKGDEIIFEGSNNIFELIQKNSSYFDKSHDVIIIKGNGNIIKLYNTNIVDMRGDGGDTLILVGDKVKYVFSVTDKVILKKSNFKVDSVTMKSKLFESKEFESDFRNNESKMNLANSLFQRIKTGDASAYFELAEVYNYGIDNTPISTDKAIDLYEYGVVQNEIQSIRRLGDIWFNGTFDKKADKVKSRYYYKLGTLLGDEYCREMLSKNK